MKSQGLKISPEELHRKLESGELVVMRREVVEAMAKHMAAAPERMEIATPAVDPSVNRHVEVWGLNVGSGQRPFKNVGDHCWINLDSQAKWNPDIVGDANSLSSRFTPDKFDYVVLHHVLEHFGCGEADNMLKECYKVLKPGGSLIVCVPDMDSIALAWHDHELSTQLYMTNVYGAYMGDDADRHKWGFDYESLVETLKRAGEWDEIKEFDNREILGASIASDWWILSMECVK